MITLTELHARVLALQANIVRKYTAAYQCWCEDHGQVLCVHLVDLLILHNFTEEAEKSFQDHLREISINVSYALSRFPCLVALGKFVEHLAKRVHAILLVIEFCDKDKEETRKRE